MSSSLSSSTSAVAPSGSLLFIDTGESWKVMISLRQQLVHPKLQLNPVNNMACPDIICLKQEISQSDIRRNGEYLDVADIDELNWQPQTRNGIPYFKLSMYEIAVTDL